MPPEGLDGAENAFQAEIAPGRGNPNHDSRGRFAATKPTPEPMFPERPVEGDSLTGDTRDGGEDAKLADRERKAADRSRDATPDSPEGHPEQVGSEEEEATPEGEGEAEGDKGEEPEDQGPKYEVTVDGQTQEVSLQEALKGYIREQTFHQRMNKVHEVRQAVEQEAGQLAQMRDYYAQLLQEQDAEIAELTPPQLDWDREYAADPVAARQKQKAYEAIYQKRMQLHQRFQQEQAARAQEYDARAARYAQEQFASFVQEANIPDEKALNVEMSTMRDYAKSRGFTEGEIATVYDKRMLAVLRDAAKYRQMMSAQPKAVIPGKGKTLTPGVATPIGTATRRSLDEAQQRLAKSGRLDDATSVFQRLLR